MTEVDDYEARRTKAQEQVKLLLAKAAGTDNEHERETFETAAATKMRRWMIDEAELRGTMGYTGAGDIIEEFLQVVVADGFGMVRGHMIAGVARAFGAEPIFMGTWVGFDRSEDKIVNLRMSLNGTRAMLDAATGMIPQLMVQCDAAAVKAWDAHLSERAKLHAERMAAQQMYGSQLSHQQLSAFWSQAEGVVSGPGLCFCGCGNQVDDRPETNRWGSPVRPDTYANPADWGMGQPSPFDPFSPLAPGDVGTRSDPYATIRDALYGMRKQQGVGSAADRREKERKTFIRSYMGGYAQRVEERLKMANLEPEAATPEEQSEADRLALVLKADSDRTKEDVNRRYPHLGSISSTADDITARQAGWSSASGADLGGQRFGGYGGSRELEA
jgi:hypothetical protein